MTEFSQGVALIIGYRVLTILVGFGIVYLGYVLFRLGVYEKAGDLKAAWGEKNLTIKQAAPGTFFVVFGVIVISISLYQGVDLEKVRSDSSENPFLSSTLMPRLLAPYSKELDKVINKVIDGKELNSDEINILKNWRSKERIHFKAIIPKDKENMAISESLKRYNLFKPQYYWVLHGFNVYGFPMKSVQPFVLLLARSGT